ncbi:MAG: bifunctional diaminohydroxyphosphoribosylaminopyrimidine deaminase/5-amino-6-(5-phosphoribosylamino)uracil reductase RibD [Planctomycetes bacterium]|nr:bifunctional diaminohydroxyphosphoribosylaminopyrimidine deaminase/5-amino-6-(5-phosphoribosylamino)uracil reductase RibD [Planctomycetota bacterium]
MREALELAALGLEGVSPNPMVGAVLVRNRRIVARGYHRRCGGPHAEVEALRAASDPRGCDLYVTLEPCAHHGRTPPCADAIIAAGVRRVVYAASDPSPLARGRGPRRLRRAGIEVVSGLLRREAERLIRAYLHWRRTGTPWVILKWAMSLDGKIATAGGESRWITGREARARAHALRRRVDAVLVGTRTARVDDPLLTPRPARGRRPLRILLDRCGSLPLDLRLLRPTESASHSKSRMYVSSHRLSARRRRELERRGIEVLAIGEAEGGLDLGELLSTLGSRGVSQVLVEGGGELAGGLVAAGLVQEVAAFVAPRILGGREAPGPVGGRGRLLLADALEIETERVERLGRDLLVAGVVRGS